MVAERDRAPAAEPEHDPHQPARRSQARRRAAPGPVDRQRQPPIAGSRSSRRRAARSPAAIRHPSHLPRNSPTGASDSMWSQTILIVAMIGTARIAPGMPQMYHQNTSPMNSATVLSRIRFP